LSTTSPEILAYCVVQKPGSIIGNIWVYSEPGKGTTFKIYLPRIQEPAANVSQRRPAKPVQGFETVLVVEDEESVRKLIRTILGQAGYTLLEANDGEKALRLCETHTGPIHLVISDVVMPQMSGREFTDRLARTRPEIKVLFISGYTDNAIVRQGVLDPEVAFLQKPFTPSALANKVREVLETS